MQLTTATLKNAARVGDEAGVVPAVEETEIERTETKEITFSVFKISMRRFTTRAEPNDARGRALIEIQVVRPLSGGDLEIIGGLSSKDSSPRLTLVWGVWTFSLETHAGVLGMRIKRGSLFCTSSTGDENPGYFIA